MLPPNDTKLKKISTGLKANFHNDTLLKECIELPFCYSLYFAGEYDPRQPGSSICITYVENQIDKDCIASTL